MAIRSSKFAVAFAVGFLLLPACGGQDSQRTVPRYESPDSRFVTLPAAPLNLAGDNQVTMAQTGSRQTVTQPLTYSPTAATTLAFDFPPTNHRDCVKPANTRTRARITRAGQPSYDMDTAGDLYTFSPGDYEIDLIIINNGLCRDLDLKMQVTDVTDVVDTSDPSDTTTRRQVP